MDHPLERPWAALNTFFSLCSVLDDEGSNLRQQKLDRQVSETGAGGRQSLSWDVRSSESLFFGCPVWWGRERALLSFTCPVLP